MVTLQERLQAAGEAMEQAQIELANAEAEAARVKIIELADKHGFHAVTLSVYSEYNDEGGYYDSVTARPVFAEDPTQKERWKIEDELYDAVSVNAARRLTTTEYPDGEDITVERLRGEVY